MESNDLDDALDLMREMLGWHLTAGNWHIVGQLVDNMATALAGNEADTVREVLRGLELAGPTRIVRIEDAPTLPAPEVVRERISQLVHQLESPQRPADPDQRKKSTPTPD